ncbi:MAG: GNAT family N-acetyltransferase [Acidobacteria bacterium]|nr:GNAT family N-acetyltransferase [Acidobacteriota bacterium]
MAPGFQPLSTLPPSSLIEYLRRDSKSPELVQWKYFNPCFNRGRERGYTWMQAGQIGGFIGLIPFQLAMGGRRVEAAWTCDWSVRDPQSGRGVGILLIRQAHQAYEFLVQLGGGEATQHIFSRLAVKTVEDAGVVFHLPLRLGAILRTVRRRIPALPVDALNLLNQMPMPGLRGRASTNAVVFEPGVSKVLTSVLESAQHGEGYPSYDFEYVQWQIGDCPFLISETCYIPGESGPRAAALIWRQKTSPDFWRMALWSQEGAQKEVNVLLSNLIRHVYDQKGFLLSVVVSRLETALIDLLRSKHFLAAPRRRPLHILASKKTGEPIPELWPLSFLDTDYAYRF